MNKKFNDLVESTNSGDRIKILEFTDKVPELMNISIGVITKPGGLTITECLVSKLPIVVINPIPGQEEENAEFLVNNNVAIWIKPEDKIARTLKYLSRNIEQLKLMSETAAKLSKPNATEDICKVLVHEFKDIVKTPNQIVVSVLIKSKGKYLFAKQLSKNKEPILHLIGGPLPNDQLLNTSLETMVTKALNVDLKNVKPYDFDSDIQKFKGRESQIIYLRYLAEISNPKDVNTTFDNFELIWLSKSELEAYNYSDTTTKFLKKLKLI